MRIRLPGRTPPGLIGIDISASAVKMVELAELPGASHQAARAAIEPLPRGAVVDGNIEDLDAVIETVKRGWLHLGTSTRRAALALPAAMVTTRRIIAPAGLSDGDLELQVRAEAQQYIPFDLEEVNLDFQVLGPAASSPDDVEVLVAAARRDNVEDRVAVAEGAGLTAAVLDVDTYAASSAVGRLAPLLPNAGDGQIVMLADIGATLTRILVLSRGQPVFTREQPLGVDLLAQETAQRFGMSFAEAEFAIREQQLPPAWASDALQPWLEAASMEIERALQFFYSSTQYNRVDCVLLAGGGALLPGAAETLAARGGLPALLASPFAGMSVGAALPPRLAGGDSALLLTACGLALRRFDR